MHEIYIIMQMYALELGSYGIIKLLTNTGFFFSNVCLWCNNAFLAQDMYSDSKLSATLFILFSK